MSFASTPASMVIPIPPNCVSKPNTTTNGSTISITTATTSSSSSGSTNTLSHALTPQAPTVTTEAPKLSTSNTTSTTTNNNEGGSTSVFRTPPKLSKPEPPFETPAETPSTNAVTKTNLNPTLRTTHNQRSISSRSNPFDEVVFLPKRVEGEVVDSLEESIFGHDPKPSLSEKPSVLVVQEENETEFFSDIFCDAGDHDSFSMDSTSLPQPTALIPNTNAKPQLDPISISTAIPDFPLDPITSKHANTNSNFLGTDMSTSSNIVPSSPQHSDTSSYLNHTYTSHTTTTIRDVNLSKAPSDVSNSSEPSLQSAPPTSATDSNDPKTMVDTAVLQQKNEALMLGLEQLERQQMEHEARQKHHQTNVNSSSSFLPTTIHVDYNSEHEYGLNPPIEQQQEGPPVNANRVGQAGSTWQLWRGSGGNEQRMPPENAVSNWNGAHVPSHLPPIPQQSQEPIQTPDFLQDVPVIDKDGDKAISSFGRIKWNPLQRLRTESFPRAPKHSLYDENEDTLPTNSKALVYGYLHKLNQSGKWQRRFFETDGECLTYFKSSKRSKLLATLDLIRVGDISVNLEDATGCTFQIQVAGRPYFLKAENHGICQDWVINLNRVREARIQLGGMKLVAPHPSFQPDPQGERETVDRKRSESSTEMVARVTVDANRRRTKRIMGIAEYWRNLEGGKRKDGSGGSGLLDAHEHLLGWQKRRRNFQMMRSRLASFVRWMKLVKQFGRPNDDVAKKSQTLAPRMMNGIQTRNEEITVEESELSSRLTAQSIQDTASIGASGSFDPSRTQSLLHRSKSGGDSVGSKKDTAGSCESSPKFGASFDKANHEEEDLRILS